MDETQKRLQGCTGMGLAHERFADEAGMESDGAEAEQIVGSVDAAFGYADGAGRELVDKVKRGFEADFKGAEVAVVHAERVAAEVADTSQLLAGVDFAEDVEMLGVSGGGEAGEIGVRQRGDDQQNGVGAMGAGFDDLVVVDDEVFAKAGDLRGCRGDFQVGEAALEEGRVGEDGEGGGAGVLEVGSERLRVEVGANQPFGGGRLLEFCDDRGGVTGGIAERAGKAARGVLPGLPFEVALGHALAAKGHVGASLSKNAVEMLDGCAPDSSITTGAG